MIMAFIDDWPRQVHAQEPTCSVLSENACRVAARPGHDRGAPRQEVADLLASDFTYVRTWTGFA